MKTRTAVAAVALAAAAVIGATAGPALAQDDGAPPTDGARGEFVCANLEQIQQLQADRGALLADRLALLAEARTAAEQGGNTDAVERIDRRIARVTERQGKVAAHQEKLATFAAEHCAG